MIYNGTPIIVSKMVKPGTFIWNKAGNQIYVYDEEDIPKIIDRLNEVWTEYKKRS